MRYLPTAAGCALLATACSDADATSERRLVLRGDESASVRVWANDQWSELQDGDPLPDEGFIVGHFPRSPPAVVGLAYGVDDHGPLEIAPPATDTRSLRVLVREPATVLAGTQAAIASPAVGGLQASFSIPGGQTPAIAILSSDKKMFDRVLPHPGDVDLVIAPPADSPLSAVQIGVVGDRGREFFSRFYIVEDGVVVLQSPDYPASDARSLPALHLVDGELAVWELCTRPTVEHATECVAYVLDDAMPSIHVASFLGAPPITAMLTASQPSAAISIGVPTDGRVSIRGTGLVIDVTESSRSWLGDGAQFTLELPPEVPLPAISIDVVATRTLVGTTGAAHAGDIEYRVRAQGLTLAGAQRATEAPPPHLTLE